MFRKRPPSGEALFEPLRKSIGEKPKVKADASPAGR
jgi:hypothetical protein